VLYDTPAFSASVYLVLFAFLRLFGVSLCFPFSKFPLSLITFAKR